MENSPGNSETSSSKNTNEEEALKIPQEDSSKNLDIKDITLHQNKINIIKKEEETNKDLITLNSNTQLNINTKNINAQKNRYPYCIVWTPIPFLTYIIPSIGHTGIATSEGIIHDFAASFYVNIDEMSFGKPTKYYQLDLDDREKYEYDKAIEKGDLKYNQERHNLFWNNCHSHVAFVLNQIKYKGKCNYNMVDVWWILILKGKYISFLAFIKTYIGFFIFLLIIAIAII